MLGAKDGGAHVGDCLHDHARHVHVCGIDAGLREERVHVHLVQPGHVTERNGPPQQRQRGPAPRRPQGPVLVVRGAAVPGAQARARGPGQRAGRVVRVHEGQEVRGPGRVVGLLQAGEGEGARDELAGFGGGAGRGLVRVEGAAVVFRRAEVVSGDRERD